MALREMADQVFARRADIGKYTNANVAISYHKAMWLYGIMVFGESGYFQAPIRTGGRHLKPKHSSPGTSPQ
jgi:hypothetical protein